ncbi:MAG TPA: helix-turn-helix transcriptional regulator [Bauldia sp.]|nr:helix-turn-helix transcriptional regulator [Bauldia sp.]
MMSPTGADLCYKRVGRPVARFGVMMGLREDRFERVSELFFEAAAVPELWPDALEALAEAAGAAGAVLLPVRPGTSKAIASPGVKELVAAHVAEGWHPGNPRMRRGLELTAGGFQGLITDRDMFGKEGMAAGGFSAFLERHGFGPVAGMVLARSGHDFVVPVSIERRTSQGPFTPGEVATLNRLMGPLRSAAGLAIRIGFDASRSFAEGVAAIGEDAVLVGDFGRVLHATPGFERHLGGAFALHGGRLAAIESDTDCHLVAAIARASRAGPALRRVSNGLAVPRAGRRPLFVRIVPAVGVAQDIFKLARAIVIVTDPERGGDNAFHILIETFGLSAAEARLARRIGRGETLRDIAAAERMSVETMRTRLKSVFAKTGTHRQAELALLVASMSR